MKPRVLIFIDWFFPGYKAGGPTTSNVNITQHLKDLFDFYVITSDSDYKETHPYPNIQSNRWLESRGIHVCYINQEGLNLGNITKLARSVNCSVWYINGIYSRYFSLYPLLAAKLAKPQRVIVSARGMLSSHALALKPISKRLYIYTLKLFGIYRDVIFHATNDDEARQIKQTIGKDTQVYSIENLPRKSSVNYYATSKEIGVVRLASFARISPEKNTLYAIQILKHCRGCIVYDIYGQINTKEYWDKCTSAIRELPSNVKVNYGGVIPPQDMPALYKNYHFMYLPTTGENFGHAILESFMNSTPVIISSNTPWNNLADLKVGWDIPLQDPNTFSQLIDKCSQLSNEEYSTLAKNAYLYGRQFCEADTTKRKYIKLFSLNNDA